MLMGRRKYAGMDATEEYEPIHPPDAIKENLGESISQLSLTQQLISLVDPSKHLGALVPDTLPNPAASSASAPPPASVQIPQTSGQPSAPEEYVKPDIEQMLSLHDFEAVARRTMNRRGWNYYSSGADDEISMVSAFEPRHGR